MFPDLNPDISVPRISFMSQILPKLLIFPLATELNILIPDIHRHRREYLKTKMSIKVIVEEHHLELLQ